MTLLSDAVPLINNMKTDLQYHQTDSFQTAETAMLISESAEAKHKFVN